MKFLYRDFRVGFRDGPINVVLIIVADAGVKGLKIGFKPYVPGNEEIFFYVDVE